jgi:hypothetical protein
MNGSRFPFIAGAIDRSNGRSEACWRSTAGAASHMPRQGLRIHVRLPLASGSPSGPSDDSSRPMTPSDPLIRQATSSHACSTARGRGRIENSA